MEQKTIEWYKARLGKFTGSSVGALMQSSRDKDKVFGKDAQKYIYQVAAERTMYYRYLEDNDWFAQYLEDISVDTKAMRLGVEREADARNFYKTLKKQTVIEKGLLLHPELSFFGASPDGCITDDGTEQGKIIGGIEIKSVNQVNFMLYKNECKTAADLKKINSQYYYQVISEIACTGAQWWDFVVYCPYQTELLYIVRITREEIQEDMNLLLKRIVLAEEAAKLLTGGK